MKRLFSLMTLLVTVASISFYSPTLRADDMTCVNPVIESTHIKTSEDLFTIFDALTNPPDTCELDFSNINATLSMEKITSVKLDYAEELANFDGTFKFTMDDEKTSDITIKGLKLDANNVNIENKPLLTIVNNSPNAKVILNGLDLSNAPNLLKIEGIGKIEIINSKFTGSEASNGSCVNIESQNAIVKSSEISLCDEGIKIGSNGALIGATNESEYDSDKNIIHDNNTGIRVVSGTKNRFEYNSIYSNGSKSDDGIAIENDANGNIARPEIILDSSNDALQCVKDEEENIIKWRLNFNVPNDGKIVLYISDNHAQGKTLFASCDVDKSGTCILDAKKLAEKKFLIGNNTMGINPDLCGVIAGYGNIRLTALFTGKVNDDDMPSSSMYLSSPFKSAGGLLSVPTPTPYDIPTASGLNGGSTVSIPSGGTNIGTKSTGSAEISFGSGSEGAASSCSASILNASGGSAFDAIIFIIPMILFGALRIRKKRIRQRS